MSAEFPARRLAKAIVRQLKLPRCAQVLHVGCGNGEVVGLLRQSNIEAYGLFDGPPRERTSDAEAPEVQPTIVHQSIPFPAQSFEAVVLQRASSYDGLLSTPEACTATANLLAILKPDGVLIDCGTHDFGAMQQHLDQFPGKGSQLMLGTGGLLHLSLRLCGLAKPGLPALKYVIPHEPISRLEWHRIARQAVAKLSAMEKAAIVTSGEVAADSPAA